MPVSPLMGGGFGGGMDLGDGLKDLGLFRDGWDDAHQQMQDTALGVYQAVGDKASEVLRGIITGDINSLDDAWGAALDGMETIWQQTLDNLLRSFADWITHGIQDLANWGFDSLFDALGLGSGKSGGFGGGMGNGLGAVSNIGSALGIDKVISSGGGLFGNALSSVSTTLGNLYFGGTELEVGAGMSGVGEGLGAGSGMGALGTGLLAGGGMLAGLEGVSALMGMPGPTEAMFGAVSSIFGGGGGGHTKESAQQYIAADYESLARRVELYSQRMETLGQSLDEVLPKNGEFLNQIADQAGEMDRLAEKAGYSQEQMDAMVDELDPWGAAMVEAAQISSTLNLQIEQAVTELAGMGDAMGSGAEAGDVMYDKLMYLVDGMEAAGVETEGLSGLIDEMIDGFISGTVSADTMSERLQKEFAAALQAAASKGEVGAEKMRDLAESIQSIPQFWRSEVHTYHYDHYEDVGKRHGGGMVFHGGGGVWPRFHAGALVSDLAHDEVPIIARRGEFVVRAESVNAATLPLLQALNRSGNTAAPAGPALSINAPLVEVHGNIVGSDESFEELVRQIETKLNEVASARYG